MIMPAKSWLLPYQQKLQQRTIELIDLIVIHCTELPDFTMARSYGERIIYPDSGTGASGHFYIDRDGATFQFVDIDRVANHTRGFNQHSIGIELINLGRYPDWYHSAHQSMTEEYSAVQINALINLINQLQQLCCNLQWIAGHQALDLEKVTASDNPHLMVSRKKDPGEMFPWPSVFKNCSLREYQK